MVGRARRGRQDRRRRCNDDEACDQEEEARPCDRRCVGSPHQAEMVRVPRIDGFSLPPQQMPQYQL